MYWNFLRAFALVFFLFPSCSQNPESQARLEIELPKEYRELVIVPGGTVTGSDAFAFLVTIPLEPPGYTGVGTSSLKKGVFVEGRTVEISPFRMAKYETTQALWFAVQEWALSRSFVFQNPKGPPQTEDAARPVTGLTWYDAALWCNAYSLMLNLDPVYEFAEDVKMNKERSGFRLPTEAEMEFAARGGSPEIEDWGFMYAGSPDPDMAAWHHGNSPFKTKPVGTKKANRLGIHDLSGNVQEWCWDWMNWAVDTSASAGSETPPDGEAYSEVFNQKAFNGGGVGSNAAMSCPAFRWGYFPDYKGPYTGFRVVRRGE
jgi:formylglycine-generating enzyme required for sulfatase activity